MSTNPARKKRVRGLGALIVGVLVVILAVSCSTTGGGGSSGDSGTSNTDSSSSHAVVYSVSGSAASASVDYVKDDNLGQAQQDITLPWSTTVDMGAGLIGASLEVQNKGATGSVTCKITENGKVVSTTTSSGAYVIATCSG